MLRPRRRTPRNFKTDSKPRKGVILANVAKMSPEIFGKLMMIKVRLGQHPVGDMILRSGWLANNHRF